MTDMHVVITMDCEPITTMTHGSATGPQTWAMGEQAVRGITAITKDFQFPMTFFLHPEAATQQADLFVELEAQGACLGLHIHPWKYAMSTYGGKKYLEHYGGLDEQEQRELVKEISETWEKAIGYAPTLFRPGTFSANDFMFKVISELGFRGGACSLPGRMMPEMRAVWVGSCPDPHRAHRSFRQLEGDLDVANMPLSVDFSRTLKGKLGDEFYPDLRPDIDWDELYQLSYEDIATSIVDQVLERAPTVPCINLVTHNHFDYSDPDDAASVRLREALNAIVAACKARGIRPKGSTVSDICDAVLRTSFVSGEFVCEGTLYGSGAAGKLGQAAPHS